MVSWYVIHLGDTGVAVSYTASGGVDSNAFLDYAHCNGYEQKLMDCQHNIYTFMEFSGNAAGVCCLPDQECEFTN